MKSWKRRFQQWWMDADRKPKGKDKRYIEKQNRQDARKEIRKIKESDDNDVQ